MRTQRLFAAMLCLVAGLTGAACIQGPETNDAAPTPAAIDENDPSDSERPPTTSEPSEPDDASSADPDTSSKASFSRLALCLLLANANPVVKGAFCRSQPEPGVRARCWARTSQGPIVWANWCYDEFS